MLFSFEKISYASRFQEIALLFFNSFRSWSKPRSSMWSELALKNVIISVMRAIAVDWQKIDHTWTTWRFQWPPYQNLSSRCFLVAEISEISEKLALTLRQPRLQKDFSKDHLFPIDSHLSSNIDKVMFKFSGVWQPEYIVSIFLLNKTASLKAINNRDFLNFSKLFPESCLPPELSSYWQYQRYALFC